MAISRDKKQTLVAEMSQLFADTKGTAFASYQGLSVADMQELRGKAREAGVAIRVVKNRLVRVTLGENKTYKDADSSALVGQLLYAFSDSDEVMAAKVLDEFAKTHPSLKLAGGFSAEGLAISSDDIKALAGLPSKDQLIGSVVETLLSPVNDITNGLSGNLHALLDGVADKATA